MQLGIKTDNWAKIRTQIVDFKTGAILKQSPWQSNLVFDAALNLFAGGSLGYAKCFEACQVGSGNNPNSIASGAITFTQSGTTITASGTFFTSAMTGAILKYGTGSGGVEQYIVYVNATTATTTTSMSVVSPTVGTVWMVQQTTLQSYLFTNSSYDTSGGSCTTNFSGNTVILQRTFIFAVQSTTYNVNEIGYQKSGQGSAINGRVVLSSTDSVPNTAYYRVQIQITFTQSPGAPTAVGNVGTNVNTAGNFAIQNWTCTTVDPSTGASVNYQDNGNPSSLLEGFNTVSLSFHAANDLTLNSAISASAISPAAALYVVAFPSVSNTSQPVGVGVASQSFSFTTAGETIYFLVFGWGNSSYQARLILLQLTTPIVLPTAVLSGSAQFQLTFSRTLTN